MAFFTDILNLTKTRKFWVGILTAAAEAVVIYLADMPEFAPLLGLLGAIGVYQVPNGKK